MQKRRRRRSDRAGRPAMRSPGRPPVAGREEQQRFWKAIARGLSSEDAAVSCGVSPPVGGRWFRGGGGMPPVMPPRSARYLSFAEREEIAILSAQGAGVRHMARRLRRAPSTVSRELRRNAATRAVWRIGRVALPSGKPSWPRDRRSGLAGGHAGRPWAPTWARHRRQAHWRLEPQIERPGSTVSTTIRIAGRELRDRNAALTDRMRRREKRMDGKTWQRGGDGRHVGADGAALARAPAVCGDHATDVADPADPFADVWSVVPRWSPTSRGACRR